MKQSIRPYLNRKSSFFHIMVLLFCSLVLLGAALLIGAANISASDVFLVFAGRGSKKTESIIRYTRLPRVIAAYCCGSALAVSGAVLHMVLNNPLASPGIIGINAGAGLGVVLASGFFAVSAAGRYAFAFAGAMGIALLVLFLASRVGSSRATILMAGVACSSFCTAITDTILTMKPDTVMDKASFSIGGFSGAAQREVYPFVPVIAVMILAAVMLEPYLNTLSLGDETAESLGMNVRFVRVLAVTAAAVLAALAVCIAGLLGFVGLIVPHIVRRIYGNGSRKVLGLTALFGGCFLVLCDTAARTLFNPYELPVGIVLSVIGAPFFLYLLMNRKKRGRSV